VDNGNHGCAHQEIREGFHSNVKFTAVRSAPYMTQGKDGDVEKALYPGVDMERALVLTDEYLLDVFHCVSDRDRVYDWNAHPLGAPQDVGRWKASDDLMGGKLWEGGKMGGKTEAGAFDLPNVMKLEPGKKAWSFQTKKENGVGVVLRMLPEQGTTLYHDTNGKETTILVRRTCPETTFVALHEPYRDDPSHVSAFGCVAQDEKGVIVGIEGKKGAAVNDFVMVKYRTCPDETITLKGEMGTFTFANWAHVRLSEEAATVSGDLQAIDVKVKGSPDVIVNGEKLKIDVKPGRLKYEE
jgi:hypothetical protein